MAIVCQNTEGENMTFLSTKGWPALIALSALAGNRSMAAPAALSRFVTGRYAGQPLPAPASYLNDPLIADGLALLAAGELIADKLPFTPNRTDLLPLLGRGVFGGIVGAGVSAIQGKDRALGGLLGAAAAIVNTIASYHLRRTLVQKAHLPDFIVALAEDTFVLSMAIWLLRR